MKMGFQKFPVALVMMISLIVPLRPNCGRAAVLVKTNTTYHCNGLLNGCIIGEDLQSELEFFMASNVIRILGQTSIDDTNSAESKWQKKCPDGKSYDQCPPLSGKKECTKKNQFDRSCKKP
ncbi:hypothetical protein PTKIN_Ptkin07bG0068200 [Pterospermum kingtungense]